MVNHELILSPTYRSNIINSLFAFKYLLKLDALSFGSNLLSNIYELSVKISFIIIPCVITQLF